ncbi:MAG: hypothetical protein AAFW66_13615, partial [Pseudomonadota bacterium]
QIFNQKYRSFLVENLPNEIFAKTGEPMLPGFAGSDHKSQHIGLSAGKVHRSTLILKSRNKMDFAERRFDYFHLDINSLIGGV